MTRAAWSRVGGLVLLLVALPAVWALSPLGTWALEAVGLAQEAGPWGAVAVIALGAAASVLAVPASFAMMALGFLYGPVVGGLLAWVSCVLYAGLNAVLARRWLRERVVGGWTDSALFQALEGRFRAQPVRWVAALRVSPMSPFHVVSYGLGCTAVPVWGVVAGTAAGAVPPAVLYALAGASVTELARLQEGGLASGPELWVALSLTLAASAWITLEVRRVLRGVVEDAADAG